MKSEDELLKKASNLEIDNIKQEREFFKHIAIISSAIVGMFVFNGKFEVTGLVKLGLIGLIIVIFLSVILLYVIIRLERKRVRLFMTTLQDVKEIKNGFVLSTLAYFSNEKFLKKILEQWKNKNFAEIIAITEPVLLNVYKKAQEDDKKIKEFNKKFQNEKTVLVFTILSWICVAIFLGSLGCVLFEIIY